MTFNTCGRAASAHGGNQTRSPRTAGISNARSSASAQLTVKVTRISSWRFWLPPVVTLDDGKQPVTVRAGDLLTWTVSMEAAE